MTEAVTGTGGSSDHVIGDADEEVLTSSPAATADTSTTSRKTENIAGFDLAKLHHYEFRIPEPERDEAIRLGIPGYPKTLPS